MTSRNWLVKIINLFSLQTGQSLIEIMVALGALSILLSISAIAVVSSLGNAQESKNHNQASVYAQQGIDILRQMRDASWTNFNSLSGSYCMANTCSQITATGACGRKGATCGQNVTIFSREVLLLRNDAQCSVAGNQATRATVIVGWSDSKCTGGVTFCRQVKVETCFANIYGTSAL